METYWILIGSIGGILLLSKIHEKIKFYRTQKRLNKEIALRKKYYRHPVTSFTEKEAKKLR